MANPWFRLYSEFATDPKVQMMSEANQRRVVMIFCIRCGNDAAALDDEDVAFLMRISAEEVRKTKRVLIEAGLVDDKWSLIESLQTTPDRPLSHEWRVIRERIFARDDYTCQYCGERGVRLECDHVIPVSRGGAHDDTNLVTACFSCNRSKRAKLVSEWKGV